MANEQKNRILDERIEVLEKKDRSREIEINGIESRFKKVEKGMEVKADGIELAPRQRA